MNYSKTPLSVPGDTVDLYGFHGTTDRFTQLLHNVKALIGKLRNRHSYMKKSNTSCCKV